MRKCLQVALVDFLRPFQSPTCDEIKTRALDSHSRCYVNPADGATSVCNIGFNNWLQVLVTVHSALTHKQVIGEALVTAGECFHQYINRTVNMVVSWYENKVSALKQMVSDLNGAANTKMANDVFMIVLNSGELTDARLKRSTSETAYNTSIELLMLPRNKYDLNYNGRSTLDTNQLITTFLDHVDSGEINYNALDGIELLEYKECSDTECVTPLRTVKAPPPIQNSSAAPVLSLAIKLTLGSLFLAAKMIM